MERPDRGLRSYPPPPPPTAINDRKNCQFPQETIFNAYATGIRYHGSPFFDFLFYFNLGQGMHTTNVDQFSSPVSKKVS